MARKPYPTDVTDEQWAFVEPYLTLMRTDAPQRHHHLRDVLNALFWLVRTGGQWRMMPNDMPPWHAVYEQARRWMEAGVFEMITHDLRVAKRVLKEGRKPEPTAAIVDGRTLRSTPESGARAGYDGHKRTNGSKVHLAVDTLGNLLSARVTPADVQERTEVGAVLADAQDDTGGTIRKAYVDQGYTGEQARMGAASSGVELEVVKAPEAKRGFLLLPRRWVVERTISWIARFRRLSRDFERLPEVLRGLHFVAFACLLLRHACGSS